MSKLIGYQFYSGDYEGRAYAGYHVWTEENERQGLVGAAVQYHKVARDVFEKFLSNWGNNPEKAISQDVMVAYHPKQDKPYAIILNKS